ncbi:M28 family metallopeptidase [Ferrimonas marina]|uniref:Zn-dependent amino-or carboxypeptidase, M28 family n=1 Tax=Ferrimonas marina TaxID=299255 RepID=A0A1M5RHX4_9GAMM|nr:M28 family metallopeptidase [Ferrimonas marina]SHH25778.1 Zn-dependent amino-or carboxypeptidase, M28 family [Ferrimonas marina]
MIRNILLVVLPLLAACASDSAHAPLEPSEQRLRADIAELSSDRFQGRLPTTEGETLTLAYLEQAFRQAGLQPGNGSSFLQPVAMSRFQTESARLTLGGTSYRYLFDMVIGSFKPQTDIAISDSELVFVGYGINAPEYGWNDYEGLDVRGKTVVMLVNDPGFASADPAKFRGTTMTYYGRWDYKFAEAGRQGAAAALIIHDTKPASYPWAVVQNSWTGPQLDLANSTDPHPQLEGWLSLEAARGLFAQANLDLNHLMQQATLAPTAQPLGLTAQATLKQSIEHATSYNVLAVLPGNERSDEEVLYTAHWDHIGAHNGEIYNGALDNASGTAAMLEIARVMASRGPMARTVRFLAVTGEEQGLLGSRYYAANPVVPLSQVAGVFNIDSTNVFGKTRDYTIVGQGQSELEQYLINVSEAQQRTIGPERNPGAGGYYRSDHFSFVKHGVPAVYARGGAKPWDEATAAYKTQMSVMMQGCYHNTCDIYRPEWDLSGTLQDIEVYLEAGQALAQSEHWPGFLPNSEFHALRPAAGDSAVGLQ